VDAVPDPLLLRKFGSAGNRTQGLYKTALRAEKVRFYGFSKSFLIAQVWC
jgi:hypothetical protein